MISNLQLIQSGFKTAYDIGDDWWTHKDHPKKYWIAFGGKQSEVCEYVSYLGFYSGQGSLTGTDKRQYTIDELKEFLKTL